MNFHDFRTLFDGFPCDFDMKFRKFSVLLSSLKTRISKMKKSYEKIKYTTNIYCSRNVHFRGLLFSSSIGRLGYPRLKLAEFHENPL